MAPAPSSSCATLPRSSDPKPPPRTTVFIRQGRQDPSMDASSTPVASTNPPRTHTATTGVFEDRQVPLCQTLERLSHHNAKVHGYAEFPFDRVQLLTLKTTCISIIAKYLLDPTSTPMTCVPLRPKTLDAPSSTMICTTTIVEDPCNASVKFLYR
ncbi:hypothetical protein TRIUR3_30302 [Triticum urartu]|uniref:Uncharacterized protein n=1 Tax=Triticum urartu TaxID=4572 RepID=M8A1A8_TRIUA|nr:hypothetical protein TRIUR3_30302 [Triticum urartu]